MHATGRKLCCGTAHDCADLAIETNSGDQQPQQQQGHNCSVTPILLAIMALPCGDLSTHLVMSIPSARLGIGGVPAGWLAQQAFTSAVRLEALCTIFLRHTTSKCSMHMTESCGVTTTVPAMQPMRTLAEMVTVMLSGCRLMAEAGHMGTGPNCPKYAW